MECRLFCASRLCSARCNPLAASSARQWRSKHTRGASAAATSWLQIARISRSDKTIECLPNTNRDFCIFFRTTTTTSASAAAATLRPRLRVPRRRGASSGTSVTASACAGPRSTGSAPPGSSTTPSTRASALEQSQSFTGLIDTRTTRLFPPLPVQGRNGALSENDLIMPLQLPSVTQQLFFYFTTYFFTSGM